jgi:hypothetical protein
VERILKGQEEITDERRIGKATSLVSRIKDSLIDNDNIYKQFFSNFNQSMDEEDWKFIKEH